MQCFREYNERIASPGLKRRRRPFTHALGLKIGGKVKCVFRLPRPTGSMPLPRNPAGTLATSRGFPDPIRRSFGSRPVPGFPDSAKLGLLASASDNRIPVIEHFE